ncbi:hypothetical protein [Paraglaciecola aestuariivivens]
MGTFYAWIIIGIAAVALVLSNSEYDFEYYDGTVFVYEGETKRDVRLHTLGEKADPFDKQYIWCNVSQYQMSQFSKSPGKYSVSYTYTRELLGEKAESYTCRVNEILDFKPHNN